ncbi:MAG: YidC/Oxa1 family membrane protein insertase [bacterium]|nr:YidC/Oxa1 family membrane protein insertase [bacterium]
MFTSLAALFTTVVYQPFLNVLVFFYWLIGFVTGGNPDMGIAVILLTVLIRFLLMPLSLAGHRSESDRRKIAAQVKAIEEKHASEPLLQRKLSKKVLNQSRGILFGEIVSLVVQVIIALMLWRIFATGLTGEDVHLIYPFMPEVKLPFNLVFMGDYDLTHTSFRLNLIQSILIFVFEVLSMYTSLYKVTRDEVVRYQLVLPVVSFVIFMGLPAGKKLFVITALIFSIIFKVIMVIRHKMEEYRLKKEAEEQAEASDTPVVQTV